MDDFNPGHKFICTIHFVQCLSCSLTGTIPSDIWEWISLVSRVAAFCDQFEYCCWKECHQSLAEYSGRCKKKVRQRQQEADRDNSRLVKKLAKLQKDREKCDAERFANVDQFMAGTLDKDVYQSRRADLTRRAERIDAEIAELEERLHEAEVVQDDGMQDALETLDKFSGATELDQKIVQALVDKVVVYDPRHVEIRWKFSDEVLKLLQE